LAVVFDLGETLLDSGGISPDFVRDEAEADFRAVHLYLDGQGYALPEWPGLLEVAVDVFRRQVEQMRNTHASLHMARIIREAVHELDIPVSPRDIDISILLTHQNSHKRARLYREALPTLRRLRARGVRTGLISNTAWPHWCQDRMLAALGVRDLLYPRIYSADCPYAKPHASIFGQALQALHVDPVRAVYVGDRIEPDVIGAQGAGMRAILLEVPYRRESHPGIEPDARIASLDRLIDVLDAWASSSPDGRSRT
jgi:HAD superfamily hydrolase (TIGR01509 family)